MPETKTYSFQYETKTFYAFPETRRDRDISQVYLEAEISRLRLHACSLYVIMSLLCFFDIKRSWQQSCLVLL